MYLNLTCEQSKNCSSIRSLLLLLIIPLLFISTQTFGQAANLDQIRNGPGNDPTRNFYSTFPNPEYVNGNAGASNAHYVEGMSISYRSLITGVVAGSTYEYIIEYDTKHSSAMALDYLTSYQRLEPHSPFNHDAEVLNPRIFKDGNREYLLGLAAINPMNTKEIPAPSQIAANTPVAGMPFNSFDALPDAEKKMTIFNGLINTITYDAQGSLTASGSEAKTSVRIRFTASKDSVVLAWGGHIASRLDWGYTNPPTNTIPRSAAGISGSPYHMRHLSMSKVLLLTVQNISLGNQDRSLSAAAVVAPPECPNVASATQCLEAGSFTFAITDADAGTVYTWSFGSNSVGATFSGGGATATGTSVTVTHSTVDNASNNGGSFTLDISAVKNSITEVCTGVATGTVVDVQVDAEDADNTLQINLNNSTKTALAIQSISPGNADDYDFQWKLVSQPVGANSSFSHTAPGVNGDTTFNVLSPFALGDYFVRVIATQRVAPFCKDSSDVTIQVNGGVNCVVKGPSPVCPGSQKNVYFYDADNDGVKDAIPSDFEATWTLEGGNVNVTFEDEPKDDDDSVRVNVAALGTTCGTSYTVKLTLTSILGATFTSCVKSVSVSDTDPPVITDCPDDVTLGCTASVLPANTGGLPVFTDNCSAQATYADETSSNCSRTVIKRTWTVTDLCGNTATCVQIITLADTDPPVITCNANGTISVTDDCSEPGNIITYFRDAGLNRTWTAVDESGKVATKTCTLPSGAGRSIEEIVTSTATQAVAPITQKVAEVQGKAAAANKEIVKKVKALQVFAAPNPFNEKVNFRFSSPVSGKGSLGLYTVIGQKVAVIYEGMVKAGIVYDVQYKATSGFNVATLIYRLTVNDKAVSGKLIQQK